MVKKFALISIGTLCFGFGALGYVVPGLPSTPFFLLTLACYTRSSHRLTLWFKKTFFYKKFLEYPIKKKGLTVSQKVAVVVISNFMMIMAFIATDNVFLRIFLLVCLLVHDYMFIFKVKTVQ